MNGRPHKQHRADTQTPLLSVPGSSISLYSFLLAEPSPPDSNLRR